MLALILVLGGDAAVLWFRPERLDLSLHQSDRRVWLFVGLDDRSKLPESTGGPDRFGRADSTGARADVMLLITEAGDSLNVVSLPRGLILHTDELHRLGISWHSSPQLTIDLLCSELDVPVTDVVAINMRGLVHLVDALGGVTVTVPKPLRDSYSKVKLDAGTQVLDGNTALALARSRQGQILTGGTWVSDPEQTAGRQRRAAEVLQAIAQKASDASWWRLHQAAWATAPDVSMSSTFSPTDLADLAGRPLNLSTVTGTPLPDTDLSEPNDDTHAALAKAGVTGCSSR